MSQTPLYNSRIISSYLRYLNKKYSHIDINELLSYAKMKKYEIADQGHWFTQEQMNRFHEKATLMTGDKNIAREAGRYAASPESLGVMREYILGFVSPAKVYEMIEKAARRFSRSSRFEYRKINSKQIEITAIPEEGVAEKEFQCDNRMGHFESIALAFNSKMPRIEHPECLFKGGKKCRYIISWESNLFSLLIRVRNGAMIASVAIAPVIYFIFSFTIAVNFLFAAVLVIFGLTSFYDHLTKRELRKSLMNRESSHEELINQMDVNYNNSLMINEIGQAISREISIENIMDNVVQILKNRLDYDRCMLLMRNEKKTALKFQTGFGYTTKQLKALKNTEFKIGKSKSKDIFVLSFAEKKPFLVNDISVLEENLTDQNIRFMSDLGATSFICCPIVSDKESIGILAVDNMSAKRPLIQSDLRLLMGIASVIGISIKSAELHEARAQQLASILKVLAATIDARDPYTAGHSEKVTEYSVGICKEMKVPPDYTEIVGIAAALHDYGKIGISDSLLKKNGRLQRKEREIIKTHAEKTRLILEQINFLGKYNKIPEIAGSHHEKLDGSGYPRGLKGSEIPFGSQIIAVADFFEAITSKRHYRNPLPLDEAFSLLAKESGKHFNEKIVRAFVSYYKKMKIREEYISLLGELDRENNIAKRSMIVNKIDRLRNGSY